MEGGLSLSSLIHGLGDVRSATLTAALTTAWFITQVAVSLTVLIAEWDKPCDQVKEKPPPDPPTHPPIHPPTFPFQPLAPLSTQPTHPLSTQKAPQSLAGCGYLPRTPALGPIRLCHQIHPYPRHPRPPPLCWGQG